MILILLKTPLAHSQNICLMSRTMTLPNVLNGAILGPFPKSPSICPSSAQQFIISPKSLTPLQAFFRPGIDICLCPTLTQSHPTSEQHLCSFWSCFLSQTRHQLNSPVYHSQSQASLGQNPLLAKARGIILSQTFVFCCKNRHQSKKKRHQVLPLLHQLTRAPIVHLYRFSLGFLYKQGWTLSHHYLT